MSAASPQRSLPPGFSHEAQAVAIGASAGGVDALLQMLSALPEGYPLPLIAVLHLPENRDSLLAEVFANRCAIPVREAADKEPLAAGTLYFAPAGYHLLIESDRSFSLSCDAPEHFSRPSIDVMMESAADVFGAALAGIVLTGANEDGAAGLARIQQAGGLTVVQDPRDAQVPDMPLAALARLEPDYVLPLPQIQALIANLKPTECPPSSS